MAGYRFNRSIASFFQFIAFLLLSVALIIAVNIGPAFQKPLAPYPAALVLTVPGGFHPGAAAAGTLFCHTLSLLYIVGTIYFRYCTAPDGTPHTIQREDPAGYL
jgi:hypothetical protein